MDSHSMTTPQFNYLEGILSNWIENTDKYVDYFGGDDLPYWFNERANVGVLAAAAWQAGFVSLEEHQIEKVSGVGEDKKGRNDLYISSKEEELYIEAKVIFPNISNINRLEKSINTRLKKAIDDTKKLKGNIPKAALLFIAPYSRDKKGANQLQIDNFKNLIKGHSSPIKAWAFPEMAQTSSSHDDKYYPGVALIMQDI